MEDTLVDVTEGCFIFDTEFDGCDPVDCDESWKSNFLLSVQKLKQQITNNQNINNTREKTSTYRGRECRSRNRLNKKMLIVSKIMYKKMEKNERNKENE
jgi:hypothetical protein